MRRRLIAILKRIVVCHWWLVHQCAGRWRMGIHWLRRIGKTCPSDRMEQLVAEVSSLRRHTGGQAISGTRTVASLALALFVSCAAARCFAADQPEIEC